MKPKELLYSLDHVGEDLLAEAEQTILVRKRRPWAGAAAAAVLLLALGAGGFLLWKNLHGRSGPAASGVPSGPSTVTAPNTEPEPPDTEPDRLAVGDCWTGVSRARFDDLEASLAGSLVSDYEGLASLPVYERDGSRPYSEEELVPRLYKAADWLGAAADDGWFPEYEETDDGGSRIVSLRTETDQGTLTVCADGSILMLYNDDHAIESHVKVSLSGNLTPAETERALRDAAMQDCGERLAERLGLGEFRFVTCDHWDPASSAWTVFTIYPVKSDPAEQLVSRYFESVRLLTNDGKTLRGFVLDRLPGETDAEAPEGLRLLGNYPIRSSEEAFAAFQSGSGLFEEPLVELTSDSFTPTATLIYLPESSHRLLMPFYRFWVPAGAEADCAEYSAVYIPAIIDACLSDWPGETVEPGPEDASASTEDPAESTEEPTETTDPDRPGGLAIPKPVELPDGSPGIQGPAGTVEALHYMGPMMDPVWADLNRDGRKELVYWCYGPTSGLFTVGLCVYGLEEDWPVLKDGVIYNLAWGGIRLTEEDGQVFLHYTRSRWDPSTQTNIEEPEQALPVTLEDGKIVLNGGKAPEGCEVWGSSDFNRFGRSFAAVEGEVKNSCWFRHWACLVWPEALDEFSGTPTVLCAVASTNGVTVTGYLRWMTQPDGNVVCSDYGLEAIDTPDPADLIGLSMTELIERYGPSHFDLGSGMYIPCWFTKDRQLLMVHAFDVVQRAELRDLTAPND